jgi:hypothetical protein
MAGREVSRQSAVSLPEDLVPLVEFGLTKQTSQTYRNGGRTGVRGVSTLASIAVGGGVGDQRLPELTIEGLRSVADAYNQGGRYGHEESFGFEGISLDYDGTVVEGTPLEDLLEILDQTTAPVEEVVADVVDLLESLGAGQMIEIPGLGGLGLGAAFGSATDRAAVSEAYALKILVTATDHPTVLQLGRARTRISKAGPAGVFRGTATGANILGDVPLLNLGNLGQRSIPCEGTDGKVLTDRAGDFTLLGGLVDVTGASYKYLGDHLGGGAAKALIGTDLASVSVPSLDLEITGLSSLVRLRRGRDSAEVKPRVSTTYGRILHAGTSVTLRPGDSYDLGDGNFLRYRKMFDRTYHGVGVHGLSLQLANIGTLDLATAAGRIFPN